MSGVISLAMLLFFVNDVCGSSILVALPVPLTVHAKHYLPIFKELAKRGHNVTVLSPILLDKESIPNLNAIIITDTMGRFLKETMDRELMRMSVTWFTIFGYRYFCKMFLDGIIDLPELKSFLNDTSSKYDLVILEAFNCQEPFLALGHKYKVPVVSLLTNRDLIPSVSHLTGNTFSSSYIPNHKMPFSDHMNFWERLVNVVVNSVELLIDEIYWIYMDYYMRSYFDYPGYENMPALRSMMSNISLFLLDHHISLSYPRPYLPNVIELGGLILESETGLPKDIEQFLNSSKDGIILFSWGQIHMTYFSSTITSVFIPVFAKLKQKVLMKWEHKTLPGKPDNVMITTELHQASVLAHPNIRLFINYGEFYSVLEAIYHGVPLLGTPIFGTNARNLKVAEDEGFGVTVDINSLTRNKLQMVLNTILNNSSYKENAMKRSRILRDRQRHPLDSAVYWIEYVLRHNNTKHLRSTSLDLPWYEYWGLDIMAVLSSLLALTVFFMKNVYKLLFYSR